MLTFFTTAKPFLGRIGVIQRNALRSWTLVHPDAEVILFGDDEGAAKIAKELGIRHEPHAEKNAWGSNRVDYMFARAQVIARHRILCYSNCDIMFMQDFLDAVEQVSSERREFLMIGRRWDTEITQPWDFEQRDWQPALGYRALETHQQRGGDWIDYFAFSRGLFKDLPALVVGRVFWDNWMVWKALERKTPVIDASSSVLAIHQNHNYQHHPEGKHGVWFGKEAAANYEHTGGWRHLRRIEDASEKLTHNGLHLNYGRYWAAASRYFRQTGRVLLYDLLQPSWFSLLRITRPLRSALGLRGTAARNLAGKL